MSAVVSLPVARAIRAAIRDRTKAWPRARARAEFGRALRAGAADLGHPAVDAAHAVAEAAAERDRFRQFREDTGIVGMPLVVSEATLAEYQRRLGLPGAEGR